MPHRPRHGDYGYDAPFVPLGFTVAALAFALWAIPALRYTQPFDARGRLAAAALLGIQAVSYVYTTRRGKFLVWDRLLDGLRWRGDERVLDLGCGRGALMTLVAARVPDGRVVGVDIWNATEQSGNSARACRQNVVREGVADRASIVTADMRELPFARNSFNLVVSSLAIHNVSSASGRARALAHLVRVVSPGGRLLIADIKYAKVYASELRRLGMLDVKVRRLGWRYWYGSPFAATSIVTARKAGPTEDEQA